MIFTEWRAALAFKMASSVSGILKQPGIKRPDNHRHVSRRSIQYKDYATNYGLRFDSQSSEAMNVVTDFVERFHTPRPELQGEDKSKKKINPATVYCMSYHEAVSALQHATVSKALALQFSKVMLLDPSLILYRYRSQVFIQRPLNAGSLGLAYKKVLSQSTVLSSLQTYQRTRVLGCVMVGMIAMKFASGIVGGNQNGIDCSVLHHILRRASGSYTNAVRVARPYTVRCVYFHLPRFDARLNAATAEMTRRYDDHAPKTLCYHNEAFAGPTEFHISEFYANKCIQLMECDDAERKWADLEKKIQRVRRGEIETGDVLLDPSDNYWTYSVYHTYFMAVKKQLEANAKWQNFPDINDLQKKQRAYNIASSKWKTAYSSRSGIDIPKNAPRYEQTCHLVHILYAFMRRTERILSDRYIGVFGFNENFKRAMIMRFHHLSSASGDEASALMMGYFIPAIMTPKVHIDIPVSTRIFQSDDLYVRMSNRAFGDLKIRFRSIIPARHTEKIRRDPIPVPSRD